MKHLLLVKDDRGVSGYLADIPRGAGAASTIMAATRDEAVARACDHAPALIVSDVQIPAHAQPFLRRSLLPVVGEPW